MAKRLELSLHKSVNHYLIINFLRNLYISQFFFSTYLESDYSALSSCTNLKSSKSTLEGFTPYKPIKWLLYTSGIHPKQTKNVITLYFRDYSTLQGFIPYKPRKWLLYTSGIHSQQIKTLTTLHYRYASLTNQESDYSIHKGFSSYKESDYCTFRRLIPYKPRKWILRILRISFTWT